MAGAWACVIHLDEAFALLPQFCAACLCFFCHFNLNLERGSGTLLQVYVLERQFECWGNERRGIQQIARPLTVQLEL